MTIKIEGNTVDFVKNPPRAGSVKVLKVAYQEIDDADLQQKEKGIVVVDTKLGFVPLPTDSFYVSDLEDLLARMS